MNATAILSIFCQAERYMFSLLLPTESPLQSPQTIYAPFSIGGVTVPDASLREQLNRAISAAVTQLRQGYAHKGHAGRALERLGRLLFNFLLPKALQEALYSLPAGLPIILTTNEQSVPWELLHDGTEFLALKRPIGRSSLWGTSPVHQEARQGRNSLLLISNPTSDLQEADIEAEELIDTIFNPELINIYPDLLACSRATKFKVLQALGRSVDLIHYSGHAKPGTLVLADGEVTTEDIQKALSGQPFVFLNACWSARETKEKNRSETAEMASFVPRDFAEAFISAGAIGFIGTLWPLFDHSSREFAQLFYTQAKNGVPVGEALRQTRCKMRELRPDDPIWASFLFYGDPTLHLLPATSKAETRHITVLVARLQGLSPLFERLGIEKAASMINDLNTSGKKIAKTYQAQFYAPFTGVWKIHFGIPFTDGRDSEHAIRAAQHIALVLHTFNQDFQAHLSTPLTWQMGISTERVLFLKTDIAGNPQITGQVERIADYLAMSSTTKGDMIGTTSQIIVDEATYRLTNEHFTFHSLDSSPIIDGVPCKSYRVVTAMRQPSVIPIVGRHDELNHLASSWRQAKKRRGRVVGIEGGPGIGKTCLVNAFQKQINEQNEPHLWIGATSQSYHQTQSYGLLAQVVRQVAGIEHQDSESTQQQKISQFVARLLPRQMNEGTALLAQVIGLHVPLPVVDNLEPKLRQKRLIEVVVDVLKKQSASQPIVLLLDNLQWADEASLSIIDQLIRRIRRMHLLILAVYRYGWQWPHQNQRHQWIQTLTVEELAEEARSTLLTNLLGMKPSQELDELILKQTGGHPLFVKEYIQLLQENNGLIRQKEGVLQAANINQIPLLNKVERVIQARLDRLTRSASQVIQNASVIGEQFEEDLLEKIQDVMANESLEDDLDLLSERRMIEILGGTPYLYQFSHGLVHEIVYRLLPEPLQRATHRLVAQALMHLYGDKADIYRLANHYYHSHDRINAIHYALQAAKRDATQWANQTALEWYGRALEKIESFMALPPNDAEKEQMTPSQRLKWQIEALEGQADVQKTIGQVEDAIKGYTQVLELIATDGNVTQRANLYHKLATAHHDKGQFDTAQDALNKGLSILDGQVCLEAGRIHIYTGLIHYRHGRLRAGLASCEDAIAIIEKTENSRDLAQAYNLQGLISHHIGESEKAGEAYKRSIALYEQAQYLPGQERANFNLGGMYTDLGQWNTALDYLEKSRELSQRTGEMRRQASVLNTLGEIYRQQGALSRAILAYEEAQQILEELGYIEFVGIALMNQGATYLKEGAENKARACLSESLSLFERLNANVHLPEVLRYFAELELLSGNFTEALRLAQNALNLVRKQEQKVEEGQIRRVLGQIYRELEQLSEAKTQLEKSLTMLEERNRSYEIGLTLVELARLRQNLSEHDQTQREQAIAECERAIVIFEELGAALDLKRAQEIRSLLP